MEDNRKITLTKNNWADINNILTVSPNSEFLRFCIINKIVENGIKKFKKEQLNDLLTKKLTLL